ncbi:aminopeptidase N [Marinicella pacifica]|uniref:Aminopeptidase N n=1 Tax=Marinicella pacifica TaxID=1171543 RepID=A0A917CLL8_9GAMM|nr:aminopeptidase N [Marinicella pacifica]GGF91874.1 aminopeptidase N [Marinicella pacifica]
MTQTKKEIFRADYQPPNYWVRWVDLAFLVEQDHTLVSARILFKRNRAIMDNTLFLDGQHLSLQRLSIDGDEVAVDDLYLTDRGLLLHDLPDQFELRSEVKIYPAENTALEGLYQSGEFFLTQCEAEGFRRITYYPDRPDVLAPFTVTIVADKTRYPVLLSNGNRLAAGDLSHNRHYCKWVDPHPKPSYLFAMVAGDLAYIEDQFTTANNKQIQLRIFTEQRNIDACDYAMQSLKNAMRWDEERFNLVYDLDEYNIVVTDDFNMGAMENKGLNIFNSKYVLAKQNTATDQDFIHVEAVIGHEYFHNWTGNRITCRDWFQLSLKEGLTVFRDQEFTSDQQSRAVKRIEDVRHLRSAQFAEDASPMSHPVRPDSYIEINNFYTLTVYEKGAEVVRMYHTLLGETGFQKGMDLYFKRHDGTAVSCDDFRHAMADANQMDLTQFGLWYSQNGTPVVTAESEYDADEACYRLRFEQHPPDSYRGKTAWQPMHIPIKLALYDDTGRPLKLNRQSDTHIVFELTQKQQSLEIENVSGRPTPSLLQGFSAPVRLKQKLTFEDWAFLAQHDQDAFNRWDAAQQLQQNIILAKYRALQDNETHKTPKLFFDSFRQLLLNEKLDKGLVALAITLPTLQSLIVNMDAVDVAVLHRAKEQLVDEINQHLQVEILSVYHQNHTDEPYQVSARQVAQRSLKNRCLWYLVQSGNKEFYHLCHQQHKNADNYTDTITALTLLAHRQAPGYEDLLADYYNQWQEHPLMINKWLSIQATIPAEDTLDRVRQLMELPVFSLKNPNAVRAVLGAFCAGNLTRFHAPDGCGYAFLADQVLALDTINPQIAARMVSLLNDFRQFHPDLRHQMLSQIKRIHAADKLSANVFEIVDRALQSSES